ncbi:hypothetical protein V1477_014294 [Vespula maculifrons]|uniref:Uncharacterized protein n=1 Tax=Vespula maculifrons TaxID=7453 RepID=A0ABD2BKN7_VESMC
MASSDKVCLFKWLEKRGRVANLLANEQQPGLENVDEDEDEDEKEEEIEAEAEVEVEVEVEVEKHRLRGSSILVKTGNTRLILVDPPR